MKDCLHEVKIKYNDIFSTKEIYKKNFLCIKCNKKVRINVSGILMVIVNIIATMPSIFVLYPLLDLVSKEIFIIKYGYLLLAIIGLSSIYLWLKNTVIWLFRKQIKYVEIEDDK